MPSSKSPSSSSSLLSRFQPTPSTVWCAVWLPALVYFLNTRHPSATTLHAAAAADRFQLYRDADCAAVQKILYSNTPCAATKTAATATRLVLSQPLQLLWNADENANVVAAAHAPSTPENEQARRRQLQEQYQAYQKDGTLPPPPHLTTMIGTGTGTSTLPATATPILLMDTTWYTDQGGGSGGAILVSQATGAGRVWRWERGGGPIPVGRTLVLDAAGCRSQKEACRGDNSPLPNYRGVGGMAAVANKDDGDSAAATLILAEWGEERIVRMEHATGARTPLILHVPTTTTRAEAEPEANDATTANNNMNEESFATNTTSSTETCGGNSESTSNGRRRRVQMPRRLHVTKQGDLLFLEGASPPGVMQPQHGQQASTDTTIASTNTCTSSSPPRRMTLWQRKRIDQVKPLASLRESRLAHEWTEIPTNTTTTTDDKDGSLTNDENNNTILKPLYAAESLGSFAVHEGTFSSQVFLTASLPTAGVVILEIPLREDFDEDEDDEGNVSTVSPTLPRIVFRLQRYLPTALEPGPLVLSQTGETIFLATNEGIAILLANTTGQGTQSTSQSGPAAADAYRFAGLLPLPIMDRPRITSMTLGADKYLYVTTESRLWRIKVQL